MVDLPPRAQYRRRSVLNSGSVIVSANATGPTDIASAEATGIQIVSQNFSGSIVNSGTIYTDVTATSRDDAHVWARGLLIGRNEFDSLENSGL